MRRAVGCAHVGAVEPAVRRTRVVARVVWGRRVCGRACPGDACVAVRRLGLLGYTSPCMHVIGWMAGSSRVQNCTAVAWPISTQPRMPSTVRACATLPYMQARNCIPNFDAAP